MSTVLSPDLSLSQASAFNSAIVVQPDFLGGLSRSSRLISIETPLGSDALIVQSFVGREAMSDLFRINVDCLSTSTHHQLKALTGEEVSLRMRLADGSMRTFHGIVIAISQLGGDGALARYRLTLGPWLHALTLRRDSYVFQDKTVLEIIDDVFRDYPLAHYRFNIRTPLPKRSVTIQYRESDYRFITRLLAEEGLNFFIRDEADDNHSGHKMADSRARHCVVVFDDNDALTPCTQRRVRFHRADATETDDTITQFAQQHQIGTNAVTLSSWDYKALQAHSAEDQAPIEAQDAPPLEVYEGRGAYRYSDAAESARIARVRAESLALQYQICRGESSVRAFSIGSWFDLKGHPPSSSTEYIVLSIEHQGANNLSAHDSGLRSPSTIEAGTYRNQFTCVSRTTPVRPAYFLPKPTATGAQVALVVGVTDEEITSERNHRVKIQFPWQRGEHAASGQLGHSATSNAPGDETTGTWVRLAEPAAGANWGSNFIARVGQEVLVDFIDGDIDRPVVIGQLYNGPDTPPFHGADNHPSALAGIRSKEHGATGFNQWVIDDSPQQLRQSLASSYSASQLNVGYIIRQNGNVRGMYRGTGFELATDAWGVIRAKRGIFTSTTSRNRAVGTQLDTQEAQEKLKSCAELAKLLSDTADRHRAQSMSSAQGLQQLVKTIAATNRVDEQDIPAFARPVALFDSQAGVSLATSASTAMLSSHDFTLTSDSAVRMSAGQAISMGAANTMSLFAHAGGAKVIAAKEPVSMRAHTGSMDMLADRTLTVTSSNGSIKIQAKQQISLASGGGYIRLEGANIDIHCPSSVSIKGSTHDFLGAGSIVAKLDTLPDEKMNYSMETE